jgi:predicted choloylglycine hydrolase
MPSRQLGFTKSSPVFPNRQRGVGFAGWLIIILVVGGAISVGTKLIPVYTNNNTIEGLMDKMAEEPNMAIKPKTEILKTLENRMSLNNIRDFDIDGSFEVVRSKGGTILVLDYEKRVPVVATLDLIASFNKEVELRE